MNEQNFTDPQDCPVQTCTEDLKEQCAERGAWIFTASGRRYFPTSPEPEEILIEDIARALSQTNRYNGHTRMPLSVAQHSVICAYLVPHEIALEALLHDAAEAYIGDMSRPIKQWLRSRDNSWDIMEDLNARAVARRFGLQYPWPAKIAEADNQALAIEVRNFHCTEFDRLLQTRGLHATPCALAAPWNPARARREFMKEFKRLERA